LKYDLAKIHRGSEAVYDYVSVPNMAKDAFDKRRDEYKLDPVVVKEVTRRAKDYTIVAFSAEWCPDCVRNIPVLAMLSEVTGLEVRIFGHIMRDTKSNMRKWAIPPSPPEVVEFNVVKIPLILVLNKVGESIGEIVENPPRGNTLEQAILNLMK
jgi:thiol-disulfide isomerase/thioredoxin